MLPEVTFDSTTINSSDVAVPKNTQRIWNSRERDPGRSRITAGQHLKSPVPYTGQSITSGTSSTVAPAAVKKEKPRNMTAIAQGSQQNAITGISAANLVHNAQEGHFMINHPGNQDARLYNVQNQEVDKTTQYDQHRFINANVKLQKFNPNHQREIVDRVANPVFKKYSNETEVEQEQTHEEATLTFHTIHPLNDVRGAEAYISSSNQPLALSQSIMTQQGGAAVGEPSQCEMAEADQASICNSPERNRERNLQGYASGVGEIEKSAANSVDISSSWVGAQQSLPCLQADQFKCVSSSLSHQDLEERRMKEESASCLTANAIVEEILNSPINSGKNTPTICNVAGPGKRRSRIQKVTGLQYKVGVAGLCLRVNK